MSGRSGFKEGIRFLTTVLQIEMFGSTVSTADRFWVCLSHKHNISFPDKRSREGGGQSRHKHGETS